MRVCTAAVSTVNLRDGGSSMSSGSCECYTWMQRVWTLWLQKWPSIWRLTCTSTSCVSQNAHTYLPYTYLWAENALIICHKKSHTTQSIQNSILQFFFVYLKSFYRILETKSESWWSLLFWIPILDLTAMQVPSIMYH